MFVHAFPVHCRRWRCFDTALPAMLLGIVLAALGRPVVAADGVVGPGNCNEAGFVAVLNGIQASGGGRLTFNCGSAPVTISFAGYKEISSDVVIDGEDRIIFDAKHGSAFFQVYVSASLKLQGLTLRRGTLTLSHPLENFGTLELDRVEVRETQGQAGALANYGMATVRRSSFIDNHTGGGGAAIFNEGAGILKVLNSTFSGNAVQTVTGAGGAIAAYGGELTVLRSRFSANSAPDGGAIYVDSGVNARIEHSVFQGNQAGYGGALETWSHTITVHHSRFEANAALNGDGGAIWAPAGQPRVTFSEFVSNTAATTGGAISCYDDVMTVTHSSFAFNQSGGHGGAVYSTCGFGVYNSTFHGNTAQGDASGGGGLYHAGPWYGAVAYATFSNNSAAYGAGIVSESVSGTSARLLASLLAGNSGGNCAGVLTSGGYNLSNDIHCGGVFTEPGDANNLALPLEPYGQHGGPTQSRPPQSGNPAIDRIPAASCLAGDEFRFDQRGVLRPANDACDSGAIEFGGIDDRVFNDRFEVTP